MSRVARSLPILVAAPHPISNLRPVLYNGLPDTTKTTNYSPNELRTEVVDPDKFQLDLSMQRIDKFNHEFWLSSNQRFYSMRQAFLASRKPHLQLATSDEERALMEEQHLSEFYKIWIEREGGIQQQYTSEWLRAQYGALWSAFRNGWQACVKKMTPS